ncbi:MAG: hypothetical protein KY391_03050, partial [Actinobacteria bacterium]|nr:hypothetical protein [Actinomycetota bacterium]
MTVGRTTDIFDRARSIAAAFLVAAGAAVILGTALDWVVIELPPTVPDDQMNATEPFTGLETKSAPYLLIAAGAVILLALLLVARRKSLYAWLAFIVSMIIGAIAFQNYRGIEELFYVQMERIGDPDPALGLMLVIAGGVVGVIAGAAGIAAVPPTDR